MANLPNPNDAPPPSHLSGFTVDSGFSVIPPKRPGTVTAASIMMFVGSGLAALGLANTMVSFLDGIGPNNPIWLLGDLTRVLLALAVTGGFIVAPILTLKGRDGARIVGFVLLGGLAFTMLTIMLGELLSAIGGHPTDHFNFGDILLATGGLAFAVTAIALLSTTRADAWFHEGRGERYLNPDTETASKPRGPIVAVILLGSIALFEAVKFGLEIADISTSTSSGMTTADQLAYYLPTGATVLLAAALTAIFVGSGNNTARTIALGLCGMISVTFVMTFITSMSMYLDPVISEHTPAPDWMFYLDKALSLIQVAAAIFVIVSLVPQPVAAWFHRQRVLRSGRTPQQS